MELSSNPGQRQTPLIGPEAAQQIQAAIENAENLTSGEIRVVIDPDGNKGEDPYHEAVKWFHRLGMTRTRQRNAVLIYINPHTRRYAVVGDEGIHRCVGTDFWKRVAEVMHTHFYAGNLLTGIIEGVRTVGESLAQYFPIDGGDNTNELPDEVVY